MAATKELIVDLAENQGALYKVRYEGGGQVPEFLQGLYTSRVEAGNRIKQYLATEKRGATNGSN